MESLMVVFDKYFTQAPGWISLIAIAWIWYKNNREERQSKKEQDTDTKKTNKGAGTMSEQHEGACQTVLELKGQIATIIYMLEEIKASIKTESDRTSKDFGKLEKDLDKLEKNIEELYNRMRRVESDIKVLNRVNNVVDDDTRV